MKEITVLHLLFYKISLSSLRSKTVILCLIPFFSAIYCLPSSGLAQTETPQDSATSQKQLDIDSNFIAKQARELELKRSENEELKLQILRRVEEQKRWRTVLTYSALFLFISLLGGVLFLNYWQGRRKPK